MGTTTNGLPWPDDYVPLADLAKSVKDLAEAVDAAYQPVMMRRGNPNSPTVNLPNGSPSTVGWPLQIDAEGPISWQAATSEIQVDLDGRYDIVAAIRFSANATGRRALTLYKRTTGGTLVGLADAETGATATGLVSVQAVVLGVDLVAGERLSVSGYQDSGGVRALVGNETSNYFSVVRRA